MERKISDVYSPRNFRSSLYVVFGHLYSVKLTGLFGIRFRFELWCETPPHRNLINCPGDSVKLLPFLVFFIRSCLGQLSMAKILVGLSTAKIFTKFPNIQNLKRFILYLPGFAENLGYFQSRKSNKCKNLILIQNWSIIKSFEFLEFWVKFLPWISGLTGQIQLSFLFKWTSLLCSF